tara:strand:- start:230 stop:520 length:291 start_codon:yes stop_codon:yes gene_type:complete
MAFRGNSYKAKTKKKTSSLYYPWTKEDMKIVQWCLNKNIGVAVSPSGTNWKVEIRMNKGDWKRDPKEYEHGDAMKKMYEYYKYYYNKYNVNTNNDR